jgi:hypothetical protein
VVQYIRNMIVSGREESIARDLQIWEIVDILDALTIGEAIIRVWNSSNVRFARNVGSDVFKGGVILGSMEVLWLLLNKMQGTGYPADELELFQRIHFVASLSAFGLLSLTFLLKLATGMYKDARNG